MRAVSVLNLPREAVDGQGDVESISRPGVGGVFLSICSAFKGGILMFLGNRWWSQQGSEMFSLLFGEMKLRTARPSEGVGVVWHLAGTPNL